MLECKNSSIPSKIALQLFQDMSCTQYNTSTSAVIYPLDSNWSESELVEKRTLKSTSGHSIFVLIHRAIGRSLNGLPLKLKWRSHCPVRMSLAQQCHLVQADLPQVST